MPRGRKPTTGSSYKIKPRQKANATKLGVDIKPSTDKVKKIDVFKKPTALEKKLKKEPKKLASIGGMYDDGTPYGDYASYLIKPVEPKRKVVVNPEQQKKMYLARHSLEPKSKANKKGIIEKTHSYWAEKILWS